MSQEKTLGRIGEDCCDCGNFLAHLPHHRALHLAIHTSSWGVDLVQFLQPRSAHDGQLPPVSSQVLHVPESKLTNIGSSSMLAEPTPQ